MNTVRLIRYDDLPEDKRMQQPNNGCGREDARYLAFEIGGKTVYRSDAMEPEDASFNRDLAWVQRDLDAAIAERARYGDMMSAKLGEVENERDAARAEVADLRQELADLRATARSALDKGGASSIWMPHYQQALEDIASEPQDE